MTYIFTICILVIFILMLVHSIVFSRLSFKNNIKKAKWYTTKLTAMLTLLSSILSFCKFLYDNEFRFIMQHGKINFLVALNVMCFLVCLFIITKETSLDIHYHKLHKSGRSLSEISINDKPKFLAFLTDFSHNTTKKDERTLLKRVAVCFFPIMLPIYMIFIFGVIDLYFANLSEWRFNFWDLFPFTALAFVGGILLVFIIALFLKGNKLDIFVVTITMLSIMSYIHAYFMPQEMIYGDTLNMPEIDIMINVFMWSAIVVVPLYLYKARSKAMFKVAMYLSMFLFLIQLAPLPVLIINGIDNIQSKDYVGYTLSGEKQYEVSSKNNVIVLVMDAFYSGYFTDLLENEPEYYNTLSDFIYYDNVTSETCHTPFSMPVILTGCDNDYTIKFTDSNKASWESPQAEYFYENMAQNGYKVRLYTDNDLYCGGAANMRGKIDNVIQYESKLVTEKWPTYLNMAKLSLYRYSPLFMKNMFIIYHSVEINTYTTNGTPYYLTDLSDWNAVSQSSQERGIAIYNYDYYDGLKKGLTVNDESNLCVFTHIWGMHSPYNSLDSHVSTAEIALDGCMTIFTEYIDQLKALGIYDNSTIILTADHGIHNKAESSVVMLIKPAGYTAERMTVNSSPGVLQYDLLPTVLECIGAEHKELGYSLFDLTEDFERTRIVREFDFSHDFKRAKKCESLGNSVFNCYNEYEYTCRIEDVDFNTAKKTVHPIVDFWW